METDTGILETDTGILENDTGISRNQTTPGVLPEKFVQLLKMVVIHLVNHALHDVFKESCYGCQVNHPSQKQHECLWPLPGTYYRDNFTKLMGKLWNGRFTSAISRFLTSNGVYGTGGRVQGATEMILYELKNVENISDKFDEIYGNISGDWYRNTTLDVALDTWRGR